MRFYIPLMLLGIISCSNPEKKETEDSDQNEEVKDSPVKRFTIPDTIKIGNILFHIDSIGRTEFESVNSRTDFDDKEGRNLSIDSTLVKRLDDTLKLKLINDKDATFVNTKGEGYSSYRYLGKMKEINQFLVMGIYDEWSEYILVNELQGDSLVVCGPPELSPDKKFIICGNRDLAGFSINGFDLLEVKEDKLKKIGKRELLVNWGPKTLKWKSNNEILVEIEIFPAKQGEATKYLSMKF